MISQEQRVALRDLLEEQQKEGSRGAYRRSVALAAGLRLVLDELETIERRNQGDRPPASPAICDTCRHNPGTCGSHWSFNPCCKWGPRPRAGNARQVKGGALPLGPAPDVLDLGSHRRDEIPALLKANPGYQLPTAREGLA